MIKEFIFAVAALLIGFQLVFIALDQTGAQPTPDAPPSSSPLFFGSLNCSGKIFDPDTNLSVHGPVVAGGFLGTVTLTGQTASWTYGATGFVSRLTGGESGRDIFQITLNYTFENQQFPRRQISVAGPAHRLLGSWQALPNDTAVDWGEEGDPIKIPTQEVRLSCAL